MAISSSPSGTTARRLAATVTAALLLLLPGTVKAQVALPDRNFEGIRSSGTVPADLRKDLQQLYSEDKQRVRDYSNGKLPNRDKVLTASYYINQLTASGRILYGDPVTQMLDRIVDTLLRERPDLRRELRVYTVKSSEVNAFATGQGMLFVNLGLVAQVEDEAQLAFVMSHEIVHYLRKHSLETLTRRQHRRDTTGQGLNDFLRYHSRSREMESEADSLGVALFYSTSPYDKRVADGFFDVLQYGYLPFDEVVFDTLQFNGPHFRISPGTFLAEVAPISAREDYDDSASTHPNLLKRRTATSRQLSPLQGGRKYVVTSQQEFDALRNLARMECIRQDLIHAEYASAYYNSYVMLRQLPDNEYLRLAKAQALYGAAKFRTYSTASSVSDYRNKEGEVQQAYHFLRRGKPEELCIAAIRELWTLHRQMPDDSRPLLMAKDLMQDLHSKYSRTADHFSAAVDSAALLQPEPDTVAQGNPKYNNVRRRRRRAQTVEAQRYVFADLMQEDERFEPTLHAALQASAPDAGTATPGTKRVLLYDPSYYIFNANSGETKIKKSVSGEERLVEDMRRIQARLGLETADFSDNALQRHDNAQFYNDFVTLNEWSGEFWQTRGHVPMLFSSQPPMEELARRHDADMLSLNLVANVENLHKQISFYALMLGTAAVVTAPLTLYSIAANREATLVRSTLVDVHTGRVVANGSETCPSADSRSLVRSQAYAIMNRGLNSGRVPGYLGRRLVVSLDGGMCFPVMNRLFGSDDVDKVALRGGGGLEFAVAEQGSLSLHGDYGKTRFDIENEVATKAGILTVALTYRKYFGSYVAPQGPYAGIGLGLTHTLLEPKQAGQQLRYLHKNHYVPTLQAEFGRNIILFDRMAVSIGARYNVTFANPIEQLDWNYGNYDSLRTNAKRMMNANLWMYNLLSLHVSVGLLPF